MTFAKLTIFFLDLLLMTVLGKIILVVAVGVTDTLETYQFITRVAVQILGHVVMGVAQWGHMRLPQ